MFKRTRAPGSQDHRGDQPTICLLTPCCESSRWEVAVYPDGQKGQWAIVLWCRECGQPASETQVRM